MPEQKIVKAKNNPIVFFDISVGSQPIGRILFELFADKCPKTAENFRALCAGGRTNEHGLHLHYKGSVCHSVIPQWCVVGGDIEHGNVSGGESIYGKYFEDENYSMHHDKPGVLSMLNFKNNTNNSQFFISLRAADWLDGQYVAFGEVIGGMEVIKKMEAVGSTNGSTSAVIRISDCGEFKEKN